MFCYSYGAGIWRITDWAVALLSFGRACTSRKKGLYIFLALNVFRDFKHETSLLSVSKNIGYCMWSHNGLVWMVTLSTPLFLGWTISFTYSWRSCAFFWPRINSLQIGKFYWHSASDTAGYVRSIKYQVKVCVAAGRVGFREKFIE